ncbi:hypothetical protein [Planctomyces sp. SH-PL14]|uniref:hypothetical protein n=1 Tax=Planctomyces sp. SH-PL14 TaxID=1632864 RepID=UPI00078E659A|nr:hypothetical protein [Planctomyces sp. SH-PL14]AMV17616.1 hypothetical protein VT03_06965 [Planctomyces sp. SH-PL14]
MTESFEKRYEGYGWIKVGRHRDDPALSWEERFRILDKHHVVETQFLIDEVRRLAKECDRRAEPAPES